MSKVAKIPTQLCNEGDNKLCESELSWLRLEHWTLLVQTEATQRRLPGGQDHHCEDDHENGDEDEDEGIVAGDIPGNIMLLIINKSSFFLTMLTAPSMTFLVMMSLTIMNDYR